MCAHSSPAAAAAPAATPDRALHSCTLLDHVGAYVGILDLDGTLLRANRTALEAIGCPESAVVGRRFSDTPWWSASAEARARLDEAIARVRDGHSTRFETTHPVASGGTVHVDFSLTPLLDDRGAVRSSVACALDVTARVEAEAALQRSEALLARASRMARLGAWRVELATGVYEISAAVAELLEMPEGGPPLTRERFETMVAPEDRPVRAAAIEEALRTGEYRCAYSVITPSGQRVRLRVHGELIRDEAGHPAALIGAAQDVTEQYEAELASRRARHLLEAVLDNIPEIVWLKDRDSRIVSANRAFASAFQRPLDSIVGRTGDAAMSFEVTARHEAEDRRVMETGDPLVVEDRFTDDDGSVRIYETVKTALRDETGAVVGTVGSSREITARKRTEEALRFQADLLAAVEQAVVAIGLDGRVRFWSRAAEKLFGVPADEAVGTPVRIASGVVADAAEVERIRGCVERGEPWSTDTFAVGADGAARPIQVSGSPLREAAGRVTGTVAIVSDMGPQRALEQQFLQAQKMEAIGRLAGGIAHDFNNMLTAVGTHAELLLSGLHRDDPMRADIGEIRDAVDRAAQLTRQLLAFSRRQILQPQPVALNRVVSDLQRMLGRVLGEDIRLVIETDDPVDMVFADRGQMEQVVLNLVVNARDAMPRGGTITIETRNVTIGGEGDGPLPAGAYVALTVRDTGLGIPPEVLPRIFEPFFTTKPQAQGTGLGLSTVYGIVSQSGGVVQAASTVGQGALFTVLLPRSRAPSAPRAEGGRGGAPEVLPGGDETILLVEDNEELRTVLGRVLQRRGYHVLHARHAEEGLQLAAAYGPAVALVITDLVMPGMNGREMAERLAASGSSPRVLFMSGYTDDPRVRVLDFGPTTAFLQKPFSVEALAGAVRGLLDR